jgi:hypothetical protein
MQPYSWEFPWSAQQSSVESQHSYPQHDSPASHATVRHGAATHCPLEHVPLLQVLLHAPQFCGSMSESIQVTPLQQMNPGCMQVGQLPLPPELLPDELPPDEPELLLEPLELPPELLLLLLLLDPPTASAEASEPPTGEVSPPQPSDTTHAATAGPAHTNKRTIALFVTIVRRPGLLVEVPAVSTRRPWRARASLPRVVA